MSMTCITCWRVSVQICLWRYPQLSDQANFRGAAGAAASTAVEELVSEAKSACNSLALAWLPCGGSRPSNLHIVAAYEDGSVMHGTARE